jgi:hypothetical protein
VLSPSLHLLRRLLAVISGNVSFIYVLSQRHTDDRNCGKQDNEDNGYIENQTFHSAPRLEHGTGAAASKGAAQSGTSRLEQDKNDYSDAENDLHCLQCG